MVRSLARSAFRRIRAARRMTRNCALASLNAASGGGSDKRRIGNRNAAGRRTGGTARRGNGRGVIAWAFAAVFTRNGLGLNGGGFGTGRVCAGFGVATLAGDRRVVLVMDFRPSTRRFGRFMLRPSLLPSPFFLVLRGVGSGLGVSPFPRLSSV